MEKINNYKESEDYFTERKKYIFKLIANCDEGLLSMHARYVIENASLKDYKNIGLKMTKCDILNILDELKETLITTIESYKKHKLSICEFNGCYHLFGFNQLAESVIGHRLNKMINQGEGQNDIILKTINIFIEIKEITVNFYKKFPDENSSLKDEYDFSRLILEKLNKLDNINEDSLTNYLDLCQEFQTSPLNAIKERILSNLSSLLSTKRVNFELINIDHLNKLSDFKLFHEEIIKINSELLKNDDCYFVGKRLERILNNVEVHQLLNNSKNK